MEEWEYWKLLDHLTIVQATLMAANLNPSEWEHEIENMRPDDQPKAYTPLKKLILSSVNRGLIAANIVEGYSDEGRNEGTSVHDTTIARDVLIEFFSEKGVKSFYFESVEKNNNPGNCEAEYYSPKLAAANEAWKAVTSEKHRLNKTTPKQALEKWLEENASRFSLVNRDGSLNRNGIEEVAKVANWNTKGGAPQLTAIYEEPKLDEKPQAPISRHGSFDEIDWDAEVPF